MNTGIIIDLIFILISFSIIYKNYRRGFLSAIIKLVAVFVAWIVASKFTPVIAYQIYDKFIDDKVLLFITDKINNSGIDYESASASLQQIIVQIFGEGGLSDVLLKFFKPDSQAIMYNTLGNGEIAQNIANDIVRPVIINVIKTITYIVLFIVIILLCNYLAKLCKIVNHLPLIGGLNHLFGALVGVAIAFFTICVVCVSLNLLVIILPKDNSILTMEILNTSKIFVYLQSIPFLSIVNSVL